MERLPLSLSGRRPTPASLSLSPALPPFGPARRPSALPARRFFLGWRPRPSQSEAAQSPAQRGCRCFPSPLPLSSTTRAHGSDLPPTSWPAGTPPTPPFESAHALRRCHARQAAWSLKYRMPMPAATYPAPYLALPSPRASLAPSLGSHRRSLMSPSAVLPSTPR